MFDTEIFRQLSDLKISIPLGSMLIDVSYITLHDEHSISYQHTHEGFEFHYVLEGSIQFIIDDNKIDVKTGDFFCIGSGITHHVTRFPQIPTTHILIRFDLKPVNKSLPNMHFCDSEVRFLLSELYAAHFWLGRDSGSCTEILNMIYNEIKNKGLGYYTKLQNLILCLIISTIQNTAVNTRHEYSVPVKTEGDYETSITRYVLAHYAENISLKSAADHFGFTPRHINRIMIKSIGLPLEKFITIVRLEHAKRYLRETSLSVERISEMVGFSSPHYLVRLMKKVDGVTVSEYRHSMSNK